MLESSILNNLIKNRATSKCYNVAISCDAVLWTQMRQMSITDSGSVVGVDAGKGQKSVLIKELQSCYVQIITMPTAQQAKTKSTKSKHDIDLSSHENTLVLFIRSDNNEKLFIDPASQPQFLSLLLALLVWQNLKPRGLPKKWFAENKVQVVKNSRAEPHELLVCRFKVYGPIPGKSKSVNLVSGPRAPGNFESLNCAAAATAIPNSTPDGLLPERWFYTMGVLKSNGMLHFITELDGTLLYSIDVSELLSSEIREVHHSICNSPNTLFIGHIKELRLNNVIKNVSSVTADTLTQNLLSKDGRPVPNNSRILIEFPLHIDLEDWFVGLNYFCKREYIGIYNENSRYSDPSPARIVGIEGTLDADNTFDSGAASLSFDLHDFSFSGEENSLQKAKPVLAGFSRDHLRVSKRVTIDLIEAKFDTLPYDGTHNAKIYAEVIMWEYPWARTSIVDYALNPFWKEEFSTDLPVLAQMLRIVIKKCTSDKGYATSDSVIGRVYITPDILTQKLRAISTMTVESNIGENMNVYGLLSVSMNLAAAAIAAPQNNNIVRLSIYDDGNIPIGKLLLTVDLKEYFILPPSEFRNLETMLMNCPTKQLIEFCNNTVSSSEVENVSYILLDIFQSLGNEEEWFKSLIEVELVTVDKITRKNYLLKKTTMPQSANVFNTLFRGSSIFTKSLERYNFRVGQEYLEKVFGNFFEKIASERKNCEIDPRYIRQQEKSRRKKQIPTPSQINDSDDSDSDSDFGDLMEEKRLEEQVNQIIDANFKNLYAYTEDLWAKIYLTSNDLPQQIKNQMKNFRNKIDLVCDPDDKSTPLNCLSAFIFLRFFCPAILNPKLFYLTKNHQTGRVQRTLTVIAKILLNLANRQQFSPHKEAHLVRMNSFLIKHEHEVFDYFDKISGRKNDFNEKILSLSHEMKRFDLALSKNSTSTELPTTPYLIDKNLRLTELIQILQLSAGTSRNLKLVLSASSNSIATTISLQQSLHLAKLPQHPSQPERGAPTRGPEAVSNYADRDAYQIGSLEFERSDFFDMAEDTEAEGFMTSLCRNNEEIFSFISSNVTLKDLQKESINMGRRVNEIAHRLQQPESCANLKQNENLWEAFANDVLKRACINLQKSCLAYYEPCFQETLPAQHRLLVDDGLSGMKLKFPTDAKGRLTENSVPVALGNMTRRNSRNPFKKWLRRDHKSTST